MSSPAQKHKHSLLNAGFQSPAVTQVYRTSQINTLVDDLQMLKTLNRIEEKIAYKKEHLLPKYMDECQQAMQGGAFDPLIFSYCVLWLFDTEDLGLFLDCVDVAIKKGISTPPQIKRDWQSFAADSIHEWACKSRVNQNVEPYFSRVFEQIKIGKWSVHDAIEAKYYKLAGQNILLGSDGSIKATNVGEVEKLERALALLKKANELDKKTKLATLIYTQIPQRINALKNNINL